MYLKLKALKALQNFQFLSAVHFVQASTGKPIIISLMLGYAVTIISLSLSRSYAYQSGFKNLANDSLGSRTSYN